MNILLEAIKIGSPIALAMVILLFVVKEFLKFGKERDKQFMEIFANHIAHNTEAMKEVSERTKQDTEATKENTRVLQELKETLLKINGSKK